MLITSSQDLRFVAVFVGLLDLVGVVDFDRVGAFLFLCDSEIPLLVGVSSSSSSSSSSTEEDTLGEATSSFSSVLDGKGSPEDDEMLLSCKGSPANRTRSLR